MASTRQDVQEKLLALSLYRGYITSREATDACLDAGLDITDVERVTGFLIDRGVIFNDDAKLSLTNMRSASSGNDEDEYNESDGDEIYDRAQADYGALYAAIKKEHPQMSHLVDVIASTLPPQENEWKHLIWQAQSGNRWARDRIVAMYLRVVLRMARDFARDFNCDVEDVFQHGSMGLMNAMVGECPPEGRCRWLSSGLLEADCAYRNHRTIAPLNAQRRLVLRLRFGLDGNKPLTLEQAGRRLGVTRERIRQIEEKALELLVKSEDLRRLWEDWQVSQ